MKQKLKQWRSEWKHFRNSGGMGEYGWSMFVASLFFLSVPFLWYFLISM